MDIGTAKPTPKDRLQVKHWGLDLVEPGEYYSAADFQAYVVNKINDIRSRNKTPILVGGTGLYIDAVVFSYTFGKRVDKKQREGLEGKSLEELQKYCLKNNVEIPENSKNKRYVIRSIENNNLKTLKNKQPIANTIIVGITTSKNELMDRIKLRAEQLFDDGVVEESRALADKYGWNSQAMTSNIYKLVHNYDDGLLNIETLKAKFITADWQLAKRQLTWLKRNKFIHWCQLDIAEDYIVDRIAQNE